MQVILLLVVIIIAEKITGRTASEIVTWALLKVWGVIEWVILHLTKMNEPRGEKT